MNEEGNQIAFIPPNSCILAPAVFKRIFFFECWWTWNWQETARNRKKHLIDSMAKIDVHVGGLKSPKVGNKLGKPVNDYIIGQIETKYLMVLCVLDLDCRKSLKIIMGWGIEWWTHGHPLLYYSKNKIADQNPSNQDLTQSYPIIWQTKLVFWTHWRTSAFSRTESYGLWKLKTT